MEVTALCISLWLNVLLLLCSLDQKVDSVSLRVEPDKLQFFSYDSVTFHCEGLRSSTGWKIVHQSKGDLTKSVTITPTSTGLSCTIKNIYPEDGGEHWCEAAGGERSNSINITVTEGSVILESPVRPLKGDAVTLRCRHKTSSNLTASFYKDGHFIKTSPTGILTIDSVSTSNEGLYKCNISGAGESPQSRLTVRVDSGNEDSTPAFSSSATPWIIVTFVLVLLLLVVALLHLGMGQWHRALLQHLSTLIPRSGSAGDQPAASAADADKATYAVVRKHKKDKDNSGGSVYYTLGLDETKEPGEPTVSSNTALYSTVSRTIAPSTEDGFYSTIQ